MIISEDVIKKLENRLKAIRRPGYEIFEDVKILIEVLVDEINLEFQSHMWDNHE